MCSAPLKRPGGMFVSLLSDATWESQDEVSMSNAPAREDWGRRLVGPGGKPSRSYLAQDGSSDSLNGISVAIGNRFTP